MPAARLSFDAESKLEHVCQACGACCSYSADWPRFSTEDDAALDRIPPGLVNATFSGMRCEGDRCTALKGEVGRMTACTIYEVRPEVCRTCIPGDPECALARRKHGLAALDANLGCPERAER